MTRRTISLGGGLRVPYPEPSSAAATAIGKGNVRTGTKPEVAIRSALHRQGLRFRKDLLLRLDGCKARPDIAFTRARLAVFVDGCFWHGCPDHMQLPKVNAGYWGPKLQANRERDRRVDRALARAGWAVVRIWEHEPVDTAVARVRSALTGQRLSHPLSRVVS